MSEYPDLSTLTINNMDVTSKQKKKIIKYIIDDRARKLGKYLDREEIPVNAIVNRKGEKMVHVCSREGSTDTLELLIEKGARVNLVDAAGNLPLHHALNQLLSQYSARLEQDLVSVLLSRSANLLLRQNHKGVSCKSLLEELESMKAPPSATQTGFVQYISSDSDADSDAFEYSDKQWRDKLQYECDFEYSAHQGRYEVDEEPYLAGTGFESYDSWADRIYSAFSSRQRSLYLPKHVPKPEPDKLKEKKTLRPDKEPSSQENVEKLRQKRALKRVRESYAKLFTDGQEEGAVIGSEDILYSELNAAQILDLMLSEVIDKGADEIKKCIREELRRWHPDKFKQKIGPRIKPEDMDSVMAKVKTIAQALTSYAK